MESISMRFRRDHRALLREFDELRNAVDGADQATVARVWTCFERALSRHLDAEEEHILPQLAAKHPVEVKAIQDEHREIRHLLNELGIAADLRTLRADVAHAFVQKLEEHAAREESGIYAWADSELVPHHPRILERLQELAGRAYTSV
jgi:hemerythrin-like domain-containing protein